MEYGIQNSIEANPLYIEQVYDRLLEAIVFGDLKPGERVRQAVLADRLGVSRQPISHALQLLRHQGLVRDAGKQGVEVAPVDTRYVVHLYVARTGLETTAVTLAASHVRDGLAQRDRMDALRAALAAGTEAAARGASLAELVKADSAFHMAMYRLSGNSAIEQMMAGQWIYLMRSMLTVLDDPGVPARAWVEHARIADFVLQGMVDPAAQAATQHIERASTDLQRRMASAST